MGKKIIIVFLLGMIIFVFSVFRYAKIKNTAVLKKEQASEANFGGRKNGAGDYKFKLPYQGIERYYVVHVPAGYDGQELLPVVLAFHGGAGDADKAENFFQLNPKADKEKFIVVYPEGYGDKIGENNFGSWNGGTCCGPAYRKNIDDVGFIGKLLDKLSADFNVDQKRIYATGMSNGAIMAYGLACNMSDRIAAIAPVGSVGHFEKCEMNRMVPTLHIHGKADPCAIYDGCSKCVSCAGKFMNKFGFNLKLEEMKVGSVPEFFERWRKIEKCSDGKTISFQNKGATCESYENCEDGSSVTLCSVNELGHTWPGSTEYGLAACRINFDGKICSIWRETVGLLNQDILANDMIWDFFRKNSL